LSVSHGIDEDRLCRPGFQEDKGFDPGNSDLILILALDVYLSKTGLLTFNIRHYSAGH
jgi:hypothetical protein